MRVQRRVIRSAIGETTLIDTAVDGWGPAAAERIYGPDLVHRVRQLTGMTSLSTFGIAWQR